MNETLFDDPLFATLEPHRIRTLKLLANQLAGKSAPQVVLLLTRHHKTLRQGRPLHKQEEIAMRDLIYNSLNEKDRQTFDKVSGLLMKQGT